MKKVGDIIDVCFKVGASESVIPGKITNIDYKSIMIQTGHVIFYEFNTMGEVISGDDRTYYIDVEEIDIPENPFNWVHSKIENEGFDYFFCGYSDCKDIKHSEFHRLRENYLKSKKQLEAFVNAEADRDY